MPKNGNSYRTFEKLPTEKLTRREVHLEIRREVHLVAQKQTLRSSASNQNLQVTTKNRDLEYQLNDAWAQNDSLSRRLTSLRSKLYNEIQSKADLEKKLKDQFAEAENLKERQIAELKAQLNNAAMQIDYLKAQNNDALEKISNLESQNNKAQRQIANLNVQFLYSQDCIGYLRNNKEYFNAQLQKKEDEIEILCRTKNSLESRVQNLEKLVQQERNSQKSMREILSAKETALQNLQKEMEEQLEKYDSLLSVKLALDATLMGKQLEKRKNSFDTNPSIQQATCPQQTRPCKRRRVSSKRRRRAQRVQNQSRHLHMLRFQNMVFRGNVWK